MGASPHRSPDTPAVAAAVPSTRTPDVRVEEAADGDDRVFVEGTMYHTGLNANAWGLTHDGAERVADDLVGRDYTAGHPHVRGAIYDRSIAEGKGAPIGEVVTADVVSISGADLSGGEYTAQYTAEVKDPAFARKFAAGLAQNEGYGVSIGIYADPESATCSICEQAMHGDGCEHSRGEEVRIESDDGEGESRVAGPLFADADADHLAHVWQPAYDGATAEVDASTTPSPAEGDGGIAANATDGGRVPTLSSVLDAADVARDVATPSDDADTASASDGGSGGGDGAAPYRVRVSAETTAMRRLRAQRGSYPVETTHD